MFDIGTPDANILAKLRAYYPALVSMDDTELWTAFINVWNELMASLCWNDGECNSLLSNDRVLFEELSIDKACRYVDIDLQHKKVTEIDSVQIKVYGETGITTYNITESLEDLLIEGQNKIRVYLDREQVKCICYCEKAVIKINYTAGYEEIPECLWTALGYVISSAICRYNDCNLSECNNVDRFAINATLKRRVIEGEEWEWQVANNFIQDSLDALKVSALNSQLGNYSNCINKLTFTVGAYA